MFVIPYILPHLNKALLLEKFSCNLTRKLNNHFTKQALAAKATDEKSIAKASKRLEGITLIRALMLREGSGLQRATPPSKGISLRLAEQGAKMIFPALAAMVRWLEQRQKRIVVMIVVIISG